MDGMDQAFENPTWDPFENAICLLKWMVDFDVSTPVMVDIALSWILWEIKPG